MRGRKQPANRAAGRKTLDRLLSRAGLCSRSQARAAVAAGRVAVNGLQVRDPDAWIDLRRDLVTVDGQPVQARPRAVWMLHKPVGYVTTRSDERGRATVHELLPKDLDWLAAVGRLDRDTSGLLLFTNDTGLAHAVTEPQHGLSKCYEVLCAGEPDEAQLAALRAGVELADGRTLPARVQRLGTDEHGYRILLTIREGRNRQVRRMLDAIGSRVLTLHRTAIGPLRLGDLAAGQARPLRTAEVEALARAAGLVPARRPRRRS